MASLVLLAIALSTGPSSAPLFELGRSKNANVVMYCARVTSDGLLDDSRPVEAHWVLKAEDGRTESLNFIEESLAYGFSWKARRPGHAYALSLNAFHNRSLEVVPHDNGYQAITSIGGVPSRLTRIFVTADEGAGLPQVKSVELFGQSLIDGAATHEMIAAPAAKPSHASARRDDSF
jgi:hypothetical protein